MNRCKSPGMAVVAFTLSAVLFAGPPANGDINAEWTKMETPSDNSKNDLAVADALHVWSADVFGVIERTTDGGATWEAQQVASPFAHFWGIDFADTMNGWAVGDADQSGNTGMIYHSSDGGETWSLQFQGTFSDLRIIYDVAALTRRVAVAVGNLGIIMRTTNGGITWTELSHPPVTVLSGVDFVGRFGYAVGNGPAVLRSGDAGRSWTDVSPELGFDTSLMDASFVNARIGWVVGFFGVVLKTTNGGRTWTDQGFGTESGLNVLSVEAISADIAWISGYNNGKNYVARTTNGGATWVEEPIPQVFGASSISDVEFLTAEVGWAAGFEGIYQRTP